MTKYNHIKEMTANNEHSEAVVELAKLTGDEVYIFAAEVIYRQHMNEGSLSPKNNNIRNKIQKACFTILRDKLPTNEYEELHQSF